MLPTPKNILFIGALKSVTQTSRQRCDALKSLGFAVTTCAVDEFMDSRASRIWQRISGDPFGPDRVKTFEAKVLAAAGSSQPDWFWCDKCLLLEGRFLAELRARFPKACFIANQDDNPFGERGFERNYWRRFVAAIPDYSIHLVKRVEDELEFKRRGAKATARFITGFADNLYFRDFSSKFAGLGLAFVGTQLDDRTKWISELLIRHKLPVTVYGARWNRSPVYYRRRSAFNPGVSADDLRMIISSSKLMLNFVSKSNRDEYNGRTFDIPACGGFLLAERTPFHQSVFVDGVEAEFFSSAEECASKANFYMRNESARAAVAAAGYRRAKSSGYDLKSRLSDAVDAVRRIAECD